MSAPPKTSDSIRLNRFLSMCGVSSRRKADEMITSGAVSVNGRAVTDLGVRIDIKHDVVRVDGRQVALVHDFVYLVLNKPKDTITTLSDDRGRNTVMSLVASRHRVYPVGRLDRNTTGVLLFTNDGEFANRLMHPKYLVEKTYRVLCDDAVTKLQADRLRRGIELSDGMTGPARVIIAPGSRSREVIVTIHEGRNKQIHRMFEAVGHAVKRLDRIAYGPVTIEGLARGATRRLTSRELRELRRLAGLGE
jgi:pseudouridine synthase